MENEVYIVPLETAMERVNITFAERNRRRTEKVAEYSKVVADKILDKGYFEGQLKTLSDAEWYAFRTIRDAYAKAGYKVDVSEDGNLFIAPLNYFG